jgi:hypothetical protein
MLFWNSKSKSCCRWLIVAVFGLSGAPSTLHAARPVERLPALVGETSAQFQIAYRLNPAEAQRRQEQLNLVVAAWRAAPRSDANNQSLTAWLRAAIRASMPGSRDALPAKPSFAIAETGSVIPMIAEPATKPIPPATKVTDPIPAETNATEPTLADKEKPATSPDDQSKTDPFRDDPLEEQELSPLTN